MASVEELLCLRARRGPRDEAQALIEARFDLCLSGGEVAWTWPVLVAVYHTLSMLPGWAVVRNRHLRRLVRVRGAGVGAYRHRGTASPFGAGTIEIGHPRAAGIRAALLHEVGHSVAAHLGIYRTLYRRIPHSPWLFQGDLLGVLSRCARGDVPAQALVRRHLAEPPPRPALRHPALPPLLANLCDNSRHEVPCYHRPVAAQGRIALYDSAYRRGFVLREGGLGVRASAYGLRSPDEWFAELYRVYYSGPAPGALLRRRGAELSEIADWFDDHVHRGSQS